MENSKFTNLELTPEIQRAVRDMGYENATEIQSETIPLILQGLDVIGHSKTGTGKTAAFGIPAIMKVEQETKKPQVLVLCPTRELAVQACGEIRKFARYTHGVKTVAVYGGQPINRQISALKQGIQIVIGTPGRIMDHLRRRTLRLDQVKMVVLDEADEMLDMGFRDDIETILKDAPKERQTVLFSATMSKEILAITKRYQKSPKLIKAANIANTLTVNAIHQLYMEIPKGTDKLDALCSLMDETAKKRSIIFCNTKRTVDILVQQLKKRGYRAEGLHGDMKQAQRDTVMNRFKNGGLAILVATDVAARGIDVRNVENVYNYDVPQNIEYYVHRIGRTGRAGKDGAAYTLVGGRKDLLLLKEIQAFTKSRIAKKEAAFVEKTPKKKVEVNNAVAPKKRKQEEPVITLIKSQIHSGKSERCRAQVNALIAAGVDLDDALAAALSLLL